MAKGFDLRTQKVNKKGQVTSKSPYRLYIDRGVQKFERPPGSGKFYNADGSEIVMTKLDKKAEAKKRAEEKAIQADKNKIIVQEHGETVIEAEVSDAEMDDLKNDLLQDEE